MVANDTNITTTDKTIKKSEDKQNGDLNNIHNSLLVNKLTANVEKYMILGTTHTNLSPRRHRIRNKLFCAVGS